MPQYIEIGVRRLQRFGDWLGGLSLLRFSVLVLTIEVVGLGIHWQRTPMANYLEWANSWPNGRNWDTSPAWMLWSWLGLADSLLWPLSWLVVATLSLLVISLLGHKYLHRWTARLLVLTVLASGIPFRMMEGVGTYDVLFLLASVAIAFPRKAIWLSASMLAGLANAEAAVVSGLCVILAGIALANSAIVKKGAVLATSGLLVTVGVRIASAAVDAEGGGRTSVFGENIIESLTLNLGWLPLVLSTGYLGAWFMVAVIVMSAPDLKRILLLTTSLILIPGLMTLVTLDGTRVFVTTSAAALVITVQAWLLRLQEESAVKSGCGLFPSIALSGAFLIFLLVPQTSVFVMDPKIRVAPWQFLVDVLYAFKPEWVS